MTSAFRLNHNSPVFAVGFTSLHGRGQAGGLHRETVPEALRVQFRQLHGPGLREIVFQHPRHLSGEVGVGKGHGDFKIEPEVKSKDVRKVLRNESVPQHLFRHLIV